MENNGLMNIEMDKKYNPQFVEEKWYAWWIENNFFCGEKNSEKPPYTVLIPPPNVTGKLHLGHAWDSSLQDIITRQKRMAGYNVLYLPGMDHAGIATQAKVEQHLLEKGKTRKDLTREEFIKEAWIWKETYAEHIREQWAKLGLGLDYGRERFTLDEGLSQTVRYVFVEMYKKGVIYKGKRMINWDPIAQTALSDIEVVHKEVAGFLYHFRYKVVGTDEYIEIATTRPETMLGDTAVAVHPDDDRYKHLHGKKVLLPIVSREIPIITDEYCNMEFGSGAVKITPAHDVNDFAIGERHNLEQINVIGEDGKMNDHAGPYKGLDRFECRKKIVTDLENERVCCKIEPHMHQVGHSERSGAVIEPYLSMQWFVKMDELGKSVIKQQETENKVQFIPSRFEKTFHQWMNNVHDWCISRQLWWGHQIPAWTHKETGEIYVNTVAPENILEWTQDEDVLDTWFSSALWPFSALGWHSDDDSDFREFYPTKTLVTGYDIIFFWVSRMMFQSLEFTGQMPFEKVLIHGLVRDEQGRKMSKSLGNGVDPMLEIDRYGADALRFYLATSSSPGHDMRYIPQKMESTWNFINKIWNASRFCLMNIGNLKYDEINISAKQTLADKWILDRLNNAVSMTTNLIEKFEFGEAGKVLTNFIWNEFCDWYIELAKLPLNGGDEHLRHTTRSVLAHVLENMLRLIHPFMPFVTEHIWQNTPHLGMSITIAPWPQANCKFANDEATEKMQTIMDIIRAVRNIRAELSTPNRKKISLIVRGDKEVCKRLEGESEYLFHFCSLEELSFVALTDEVPENAMTAVVSGAEIIIPLEDLIDPVEESNRLKNEQKKLQLEVERLEKTLGSNNFLSKANPKIIEEKKKQLHDYKEKYNLVVGRINILK